MSNEVYEKQNKDLEEKESTKVHLKSQVKKGEKELESSKVQFKVDLDLLRDTLRVVTKNNNELKEALKNKEAMLVALSEETTSAEDANNEDLTVSVEIHNEDTNQRVSMNKESAAHKCVACDKDFNASGDLERHLKDKHTESVCNMCDKKFTSTKQAQEHICLEGEIVPQTCEKSYCNKQFVSTATLQKHMKSNHFGNQRSVCKKCGEIGGARFDMKKHMETCGKSVSDGHQVQEKRKEVCKHWRQGRCDRGTQCMFSHVGQQNTSGHESPSTAKALIPCRNGPSCSFLARGRCNFQHHNEKRHEDNRRRQSTPRIQSNHSQRQSTGRDFCRFGANCDRVVNCPNVHNMQDFPQYNKNHGFRGTNRSNNGRFRS